MLGDISYEKHDDMLYRQYDGGGGEGKASATGEYFNNWPDKI